MKQQGHGSQSKWRRYLWSMILINGASLLDPNMQLETTASCRRVEELINILNRYAAYPIFFTQASIFYERERRKGIHTTHNTHCKEENIEVLICGKYWCTLNHDIISMTINSRSLLFIYDGCQFLIRSKKQPTYSEILDVIKALIEGKLFFWFLLLR